MKTLAKCLMVALIGITATTTCIAQEWTKAQLEVWQVVEDSWNSWKADDIEGVMASTHEQYQGWNNQQPLPVTKDMVMQLYQNPDFGKLDYYTINPARIVITENAAVVDYYYTMQISVTHEEEDNEVYYANGQNVEFYVKEGGNWLMLGDMTTINYEED